MVGGPCLTTGAFLKPLAVAAAGAEPEGASPLIRGDALLDATDVEVGVDAVTGAGTAVVNSGCGQRAAVTPAARTPVMAIGPAARASRTARLGRHERRGRGRAKLRSPE